MARDLVHQRLVLLDQVLHADQVAPAIRRAHQRLLLVDPVLLVLDVAEELEQAVRLRQLVLARHHRLLQRIVARLHRCLARHYVRRIEVTFTQRYDHYTAPTFQRLLCYKLHSKSELMLRI